MNSTTPRYELRQVSVVVNPDHVSDVLEVVGPAPQPIHPRLPLQARPKPPAKPPVKPPPKRAEGPTPPDPCDNARQVCG